MITNETEIASLIVGVGNAMQKMGHVPGRGDPEPLDEYRIIVTARERDTIIEALRHYRPLPATALMRRTNFGKSAT